MLEVAGSLVAHHKLASMNTMAAVALVGMMWAVVVVGAVASVAEPAGLAVASVAELVEPAVASVAELVELAAELAVGPAVGPAVASVAQTFAYPGSLGPASFWPIPLMPSHPSSCDPWQSDSLSPSLSPDRNCPADLWPSQPP
jgi:hypothetical protein